jgi:hypothetical protein
MNGKFLLSKLINMFHYFRDCIRDLLGLGYNIKLRSPTNFIFYTRFSIIIRDSQIKKQPLSYSFKGSWQLLPCWNCISRLMNVIFEVKVVQIQQS